ncbi:T9SS sorting signal type C domain-containing protein [Flavobacterium sp. HJSW_4]|uniref:T9SS sorting signal type C domain-containing protein n=1 Tax=Flavobacterium sp. HJSW_4 TaxID=3344660 RepID=UPI0035F2447F
MMRKLLYSFLFPIFKSLPKRLCTPNLILLCIGMFFAFGNSVSGQITQQIAWTKAYDSASLTGTGVSFATTPGSNRVLVVAIATTFNRNGGDGTQADPTISYGGVNLTKATGNGSTNGRVHTWLYYLKDNVVMDGSSYALNVTGGAVSGSTTGNMTVWYSVFDNVNQSPLTYTTGNGFDNSSPTGATARLSGSMAVNTNEQAVYISNTYNESANTTPVYTINSNWTSGGTNNGGINGGNAYAWKNEVTKRNIPTTNLNDQAATSAMTPNGAIRYCMSAMSFPRAIPTITSFGSPNGCVGGSITINGTNLAGTTAANVKIGGTPVTAITSISASQIIAVIGNGTTGIVTVTNGSGTANSPSNFTVNQLPTISNAGPDQTGNSTSFALAANAPTVGTGAWSVANGPSTLTSQFSNTSIRTATFTPAVSGTYVLNWTITNTNGCTSTDQVIISTCVSNLIKNGDFSAGSANWTFASALGDRVEINQEGTYFTTTGSNDNTAELDSEASLKQTVTVVPNVPYTLSFIYAKRPGAPENVAVNIRVLGASYSASTSYRTNVSTTAQIGSFSFTPTNSSIDIEFYNPENPSATFGSIIDNIVLLPSSQVVPIATTVPKGTFKTLEACAGVPVQLDVENVPASGVTYSWASTSPGAVFSSNNIKNPTITFTGSGLQNATVTVTSQGGCASAPSTTYVNVKAAPTVYTVTGGGAYCSGTTTGVAIGLSNSTSGVSYQLKLDGNNSGNVVSGTGSAISFGSKTTAGTYTVVATNASPNSCSLNMNGSVVVTIDPISVGGSIAGSTAVCSGTNSTTLTLSGHTGSVTKWQSSPSNTFSPVTDIPNSANTTLIIGNLTTTTYYRAVIKSGTCSSAESSIATITVNPLPTLTAVKDKDFTCESGGTVIISNLPANWTINQTGQAPQTITGTTSSRTITGLAAGNYNFTVTNNASTCTSNVAAITINNQTSSTTWNGSGWSNGLPDGNKSIIIAVATSVAATQPFTTATPDIYGCSLTVNSGAVVTIPSDVTLHITNIVATNGQLIFETNSSLLQTTNAVNTGNIVYKRATSIRRFDLTYWSSPVTKAGGFTMHDFSPTTLGDKYFYFNPSSTWVTNMNGTMSMETGNGYSIRGPQEFDTVTPSTFTGTFTGVPNNGDITVTGIPNNGVVTMPIIIDKFFLFGNPYPSAIDAAKLLEANKDVLGPLYFWTHATAPARPVGDNTYRYSSNDFTVFTLAGSTDITGLTSKPFAGMIAAGQGFIAKPKSTQIHFNNGMRVGGTNNGEFFKTAKTTGLERNRIWLNIKNAEGAFKQILVGYVEGATNSVDYNYDAATLSGNTYIDFYSINETKKLTIQARALPFDNTDTVPLGYKTTIEGDFTIGIDHADGFFDKQEVYLEDKTTGKIINLRNENYTFNTVAGTFTERFAIRYTSKTLGTGDFEDLESSVLVSVNNKVINITSSKETIKDVNVFNVGAQLLYNKNKVNSQELQISNLHSADQVLLVKVTLENGSTVTKKVIFSNL